MTDPVATPAARAGTWNVANGLTMLRLALVPVFAICLLHDDGNSVGWRLAATAIFAVASITDRIDGDIARKRGLVTPFGQIADPIADKALTGTALVGLSLLDLLPWWVTVVILVREIGVTVLRFWVIRHGVIPASRGGKAKTFAQALAIGLYLLPLPDGAAPVAVAAMAVALALTLVTGADYVVRAIRLRRVTRPVPGQAAAPRPAPGQLAPADRLAPDRLAPDQVAPDRLTPDQVVPDRLVPDQVVPDRLVPDQVAPADRLAPADGLASVEQLAPADRVAPPERLASAEPAVPGEPAGPAEPAEP